jgi:hypothetical protein
MNARKNFCRKTKEMKISEALFDRTRRSAAQNRLVNRAIHEVWPSIETLSKCRRILKEFPNKTLISRISCYSQDMRETAKLISKVTNF